jgi:hypothetical protein
MLVLACIHVFQSIARVDEFFDVDIIIYMLKYIREFDCKTITPGVALFGTIYDKTLACLEPGPDTYTAKSHHLFQLCFR